MNKFLKGAVTAAMGGVMIFAAACTPGNTDNPQPGNKTHNTETRVLQLSTGTLDGNFNPFFYTSGNDGNMLSLTQLGMLTMNEKGELVWGEDQACVTLDYKSTRNEEGEGDNKDDKEGTTKYEFIIKKGIKFSDGVDLTIKDVLFSLYVNLDLAYTGSSTMYSTDIVGLTKYRTQSPTASSDADFEREFTEKAQERINAIISWADDSPTMETTPSDPQIKADLETTKTLFKKELETDWTSVYASFPEGYKDSYRFTEAWQAYLFNEGIVHTQTYLNNNGVMAERFDDTNGNGKKDDGELYYTTLDKPQDAPDKAPADQAHIEGIADATGEDKVSAYMAQHNCDRDYATLQLQKEYCMDVVYTTFTEKSNFESNSFTNPLVYWATASEVLTEFAGQARTAKYEEIKAANGGKLIFTSIAGITTSTTTTDFSGKELGGTYDVLSIEINGIDPKAEYNFAFTVCPLHYYSGTYTDPDTKITTDYVTEFNGKDNFGVATGDGNFFSTILKDPEKNGLPVGAGPYKASNINGTANSDRSSFFANGVVYFMRNDNFQTVGKGISNAKIKYINYKELTDDRIMEALTTQSIDFGMPNANTSNVNIATQNKDFLGQEHYRTGGYGYVGVNPKFVPEYKVRQAIMKAMDTSMTAAYYGGLAEVIYRPISKTSWADPDVKTEYPSVAYATSDAEITKLVTDSGYVLEGGIFTKRSNKSGMTNAAIGSKLELKFTIAGETTDHPAMQMFREARDRLNRLGFKITVANERNALKDMISGNLAVWAAAWASALDPDPYQIYHKESKATNPNNWNYPQIKKDTAKWAYEWSIIEELSDKIEEGRNTIVRDVRKNTYAECFDLIMDLAVELPTYQRDDLCVYNKTVIDADSLVKNPSYITGLFDRIWEIDYV